MSFANSDYMRARPTGHTVRLATPPVGAIDGAAWAPAALYRRRRSAAPGLPPGRDA